jgi:hypothetical protein
MDSLMTWINSPEGQQAKAEDGVVDASIRVLTEVK